MLELPGMTNTGDDKKDLDAIRRYLGRLVPQLEMELTEARQDGYQNAYNALSQGVGAADTGSTSGALAEHILARNNPHHVTLAQLGYSADKFITVTFLAAGLMVRLGEKKGLQIVCQDVTMTISEWTQHGGIAYADIESLGDWEYSFSTLYHENVMMQAGTDKDFWPGPMAGNDGESMGGIRIYHECGQDASGTGDGTGTFTDDRNITMTVIGLGVFGYGDD